MSMCETVSVIPSCSGQINPMMSFNHFAAKLENKMFS